jgi:group I intron endonuclease
MEKSPPKMDELPPTGIYGIFLNDGRCYVGSTAQPFKKRWMEHRQRLNKGTHPNLHLIRAWAKYGQDAFEFRILEVCDISDERIRVERENHWIFELKPEFNMAPVAGSVKGIKRREETKELLREINLKHWEENPRPKGYKRPEEVAKAIAIGKKGLKQTPEHTANVSKALKGRISPRKGAVLSDETKQKISVGRSGIARKPEDAARAAESNRGKKRTDEQKALISASLKGKGGKLTEAQAREIKYSEEKSKVLEAKFGISRAQVTNIRSGKSWGHLT